MLRRVGFEEGGGIAKPYTHPMVLEMAGQARTPVTAPVSVAQMAETAP